MSNREYKFRGQRVDNGEWVYGYYTEWGFSTGAGYAIIDYESPSLIYEVKPETVGQYTTYKYNKIELYEDDIVEIEYYKEAIDKNEAHKNFNPFKENVDAYIIRLICSFGLDCSYHLIRFDDNSNACYAISFGGSAVKSIKIIGNIHQNPELISK